MLIGLPSAGGLLSLSSPAKYAGKVLPKFSTAAKAKRGAAIHLCPYPLHNVCHCALQICWIRSSLSSCQAVLAGQCCWLCHVYGCATYVDGARWGIHHLLVLCYLQTFENVSPYICLTKESAALENPIVY